MSTLVSLVGETGNQSLFTTAIRLIPIFGADAESSGSVPVVRFRLLIIYMVLEVAEIVQKRVESLDTWLVVFIKSIVLGLVLSL